MSSRPAKELEFHEPPWDAPLDVRACIAGIPPAATVKGLFLQSMVVEAQRRRLVLKSARERYVPFVDYPLVEHVRLLVEVAQAFFPSVPLRQGLRKLGRAALPAVMESMLGKVVWASADDVHAALAAVEKCHTLMSSSIRMAIVEQSPGRALLHISGVHYFLDSHHVGVFEGVLRGCKAKGAVTLRLDSAIEGDLLLTWKKAE